MSARAKNPSPLAGEGGEDRRSEPGEGENSSPGVSTPPPHPTPRSRSTSPSPARGEGVELCVPKAPKARAPIVATSRHARALRGSMTDAERKLWHALRARRFAATKFRRQVPIGPYVADFLCYEKRLVIEVDGSQHADSKRDKVRDRWFAGNGFRVLRFWNNEVLTNLDGVSTAIVSALAERRYDPFPARGEGKRAHR